MLISNDKVKDGDIILFRLIDGTDIIAKQVSHQDDNLVVSKPLVVHLQMVQDKMAMQFIPISVIHDTETFTYNSSILQLKPSNKIVKNLKDSYTETTSPIIQPNKGLIV